MEEPIPKAHDAILEARDLCAGYGKKQVLHGVSFAVKKGSITALIGPNGSGKSTTLKSIFGLLPVFAGEILFEGSRCIAKKPVALIQQGLVFSPQGNQVFRDLTVRQNLLAAASTVGSHELDARIEEVESFFPILHRLKHQRSAHLSGGEKQQLALGMALVRRPRILLLDEPSIGLAPNRAAELFLKIKELNQSYGVSLLIVEHRVNDILRVVNSVVGLRRGRIFDEGPPQAWNLDRLKELFLG
ncbi:MAG: ABC transporter ATP-binding protein [Candidatus Hydrogenedentes bacterium]|nr:ABC transporter ATP-binding protein [Candidatus Hydrogenedentota bacterium]